MTNRLILLGLILGYTSTLTGCGAFTRFSRDGYSAEPLTLTLGEAMKETSQNPASSAEKQPSTTSEQSPFTHSASQRGKLLYEALASNKNLKFDKCFSSKIIDNSTLEVAVALSNEQFAKTDLEKTRNKADKTKAAESDAKINDDNAKTTAEKDATNKAYEKAKRENSDAIAEYDKAKAALSKAAAEAGATNIKNENCRITRNQVVSLLMTESVLLCSDHLNSIYGNEAAFGIATGTLAALSSGLASISSGTSAATLSAFSAFSISERALGNEVVYKTMITPAIAKKITQLRKESGAEMLRRRSESITDYSLEEAIYDVLQFHEKCSFRAGLEAALAEGTQTTTEVKKLMLEGQAARLRTQIQAYRQINAKGASTTELSPSSEIGDPILKPMVQEYEAIEKSIANLSGIVTQ